MYLFLFFLSFFGICFCQQEPWLPKILWTFWQEPIKETDYLMMSFLNNHKQYLPDWQIRHMNRNNMWVWLDNIPNLKDIYQSYYFKNKGNAKKSDLIRLAIMHHYGGVWMDFTIILTQNFDWLLNLKNNYLVKNKYGDNPQIFIFESSEHGDQDSVIDKYTKQQFLIQPTLQLFFMAARPGNKFSKQFFDYFVQVVKKTHQKYGQNTSNSWLLDYSRANNLSIGGYPPSKTNYFQSSISGSIYLQLNQRQLDSKRGQSQPRQLAVKNYKLWVMGTQHGAYIIQQIARFKDWGIVNLLAQTDIKYLQSFDLFPKYFVKLYHDNFEALKEYFLTKQIKQTIPCPQSYFILRNSILYKYLLSKLDMKFYQNQIFNFNYNKNCITPTKLQRYQLMYKGLQLKQKKSEKQNNKFLKNQTQQIVQQKIKKLYTKLALLIKSKSQLLQNETQRILEQQKKMYEQKYQSQEQKIKKLKKMYFNKQQQANDAIQLVKIISVCMMICLLILMVALYMCIKFKTTKQQVKQYKQNTSDLCQRQSLCDIK